MTGVEKIMLALLLTVFIGGVAGFLGGLFGMGGGVVLVPAFLALFDWLAFGSPTVIKEAVGTSLLLVVPTGLGAVRRQCALGNLDTVFCRRWIPYIILGALIGAILSRWFADDVLKVVFLCYLIVCIVILLALRNKEGINHQGPRGWPLRLAAAIIGGFSVMLGTGGGSLVGPYMKLQGVPLKKALGISSATTIAIGAAGSIGMIVVGWNVPGRLPYSLGYVNIIATVITAPLMYWISPMGVSLAHKLSKPWLMTYYVIFLMFVFGYMFWHTMCC